MELTIIGNFMNKIFIIRFSEMVLGDGIYIELNKSFSRPVGFAIRRQ